MTSKFDPTKAVNEAGYRKWEDDAVKAGVHTKEVNRRSSQLVDKRNLDLFEDSPNSQR